jgi:hypothetical protein
MMKVAKNSEKLYKPKVHLLTSVKKMRLKGKYENKEY